MLSCHNSSQYVLGKINGYLLKRLSMLDLIDLIAALVWKRSSIFLATISDTIPASLAFAGVSMLLGFGIGLLSRVNVYDTFAVAIEFTVRKSPCRRDYAISPQKAGAQCETSQQ